MELANCPTTPHDRRILLAVSTHHWGPHVVENAIADAQRLRRDGADVGIDVLYITEDQSRDRAVHAVGEMGFLGPEAQEDVKEVLDAERQRVADTRVRDVEAACHSSGIDCSVCRAHGDFVEVIATRAQAIRYDAIHVSRDKRQVVRRLLRGDDTDKVAKVARKRNLGPVTIDED